MAEIPGLPMLVEKRSRKPHSAEINPLFGGCGFPSLFYYQHGEAPLKSFLPSGPEFYWHGKGFFGPSQKKADVDLGRLAQVKEFYFLLAIFI